MDLDKQKVILELLLSSSDLFAQCNPIIKPQYFDPLLKKTIAYAQEYFEKNHALPTPEIIKAETKLEVVKHKLEKHEQKYVSEELETFCRNKAIEQAILSAPVLLEKQDFGTLEKSLKEAIQVSLNKDLGISYFDNVEGRLRDLLNNSPVMSTGWTEVDQKLGGGISRQELSLWCGASGTGKSIFLSNLSVNLIKQGYNVVYISLELADRVVSKRFDSMTTGISQSDILSNINKVVHDVESFKNDSTGELFIKRMPESVTSSNNIRAYLKELEQAHGFRPDVLVIDYLDLMATNNKSVSIENMFMADKLKSEEARALGLEFDCHIATASQLGRSSLEAEKVGQQHIQGGFSKVQTCDAMMGIIQTDAMRAAGEYVLEMLKTRNSGGVGDHVLLHWDPIALRISSMEETNQGLKLEKKEFKPLKESISVGGTLFDKSSNNSLLNLIKT